MSNRPLVIAIDGPAASGKSTTARRVADALHYTYIDTGAMYRAVTLAVLRRGLNPEDRQGVEQHAETLTVEQRRGPDGDVRTYLDGEDVSTEIRTQRVTALVSLISSYSGVRRRMVALQQRIGEQGGVVLDGRDIGTVVFPNADVKVFMVADLKARAERRRHDMLDVGNDLSVTELEQTLAERDRLDSSRDVSPLKQAEDAVLIDTSCITIEEQVECVLELARRKLQDDDGQPRAGHDVN